MRDYSLITDDSMKIKIENQHWEHLMKGKEEESDDDEEEEEEEDDDDYDEDYDEENVTHCNKRAKLENRQWWDDSGEEEDDDQEEESDEADFIKMKDNPVGLNAIFQEELNRRRQTKPPELHEIHSIIHKQRLTIQNETKPFWRSIKEIDFENIYLQHMNLPEIELLLQHCGKYLKKLRIKSLTDSKILPIIRKYCSRLVKLDIEVMFDNKSDFDHFCSNMQHLRYLKFFTNYYTNEKKTDIYTKITNSIQNKNKLIHLDLSHCYLNTNINFGQFASLEYLDISYIKVINDQVLITISQFCKQIKNLNIEGCGEVTDTGVSSLRWILSLEKLNISLNKNITNQALTHFFNSLSEFSCGGCEKIGDSGIMSIIEHTKTLKKLEVYGTLISEETLYCANNYAAGMPDGSRLVVIADGSLRKRFKWKLKNSPGKNCLSKALCIRYTIKPPWSVVSEKEHMFLMRDASIHVRVKKEGEEVDSEEEVIDVMGF